MLHPLVPCITLAIGLAACSEPQGVFFEQEWNRDFHRRALESGDTLAIGAIFCDRSRVYLNDQAAGTVVVFDRSGKKTSVIALQGIGRGSWCGDDFIAKDSLFLFVNSVDRRLERFSAASGKRLPSQPLPYDAFAAETKRSRRIIDRIELVSGTVLVGNSHLLVALESRRGTAPLRTAAENKRFALVGAAEPLFEISGALVTGCNSKRLTLPPTHYAIAGKRFFTLDNRLFAVSALQRGVRIVEVK